MESASLPLDLALLKILAGDWVDFRKGWKFGMESLSVLGGGDDGDIALALGALPGAKATAGDNTDGTVDGTIGNGKGLMGREKGGSSWCTSIHGTLLMAALEAERTRCEFPTHYILKPCQFQF